MINDSLGDRIKGYEELSNFKLLSRIPVILRVDGRAFHTFCRGFKKPFDTIFSSAMSETLKYLCEHISDCVFGYTQSDEITLVLYETEDQAVATKPWFNNRIQKLASITASMATLAFNKFFRELSEAELEKSEELDEYGTALSIAIETGATFDCRAFNVPTVQEAVNCLIWRQQDATKNSILNLGQAHFSHKTLHNKNCAEIQDMLLLEKGINWNDQPVPFKRGVACIRTDIEIHTENGNTIRKKWIIDNNMPIITQDKDYILKQF